MSIILEEGEKTVNVLREERTSSIHIDTPYNKPFTFTIQRQIRESHDGEVRLITEKGVDNPTIYKKMDELFASPDILTYLDIDGNEKTIPVKDVPMIIKYCCDKVADDVRG